MKKIDKQTKIHLLILIIFCLIQAMLITRFQFIFGSETDWIRQHIVFPEYFRNLFYQTGNLFPNFAPHIGSGQNIFYFAYYGLYNPIILLSYLFPFIPMGIYMIISSILLVIVSVILFYFFLKKNQIPSNICFLVSLLFLCSSSFLFHAHRHIMFINYMPFLIMALLGVYRYFEKNKSELLIISVFLIILTSYYYSIGSFITIYLYGIYYYLKKKEVSIKKIIQFLITFSIRILIGILLAGFFLFPVIYVILNGRNTLSISLNFSYFIPYIDLNKIMYGTYGIGLTAILWISFIYQILFMKKEYKITTIILGIMISFPIINLILNGGLYQDGKVFIPLMPFFLFLIANTIKDITDIKISWKRFIFIVLSSSIMLLKIHLEPRYLFYYLELIVTLYLLWLYQRKKKLYYLIPIIISAFMITMINHYNDHLISMNDYQKQLEYNSYPIDFYLNQNTDSIYRYQDNLSGSNSLNYANANLDYRTTLYSSTSNLNYWNQFYETFNNNDIYRNHFMLNQTNNLFFLNYMGIRYLLTNDKVPYGYQVVKTFSNGTLYENKNTYPIAWVSNHLLNTNEYQKLSYLEQLEAYQNNIIVSGESQNANLQFNYHPLDLEKDFIYQDSLNLSYAKTQNGYQITSKKNGKLILNLSTPINDSALVIHFKIDRIPSCKEGDIAIKINEVQNKLTCKSWKYYNQNETFDYVISNQQNIDQLTLEFTKGIYLISDIEIYQVPCSFFQEKDITELKIDFSKTKGDRLEGNIQIEQDGYMIFTIPYDNGFRIQVDGKPVEIEKVNNLFLGFPISKGQHQIDLTFEAPYANFGKGITLLGIILTTVVIISERKKKEYKFNRKGNRK